MRVGKRGEEGRGGEGEGDTLHPAPRLQRKSAAAREKESEGGHASVELHRKAWKENAGGSECQVDSACDRGEWGYKFSCRNCRRESGERLQVGVTTVILSVSSPCSSSPPPPYSPIPSHLPHSIRESRKGMHKR